MTHLRKLVFGLTLAIGAAAATSAFALEIQYWQYIFDARVRAMDELIKRFEAANPDITVTQTTFPYADYQTKIAAAIAAGQGPAVVQFYYGWLDKFRTGRLISRYRRMPSRMIRSRRISFRSSRR